MNCRTCKYLDVPADSLGRVRPRGDSAYRCLAPDPAMPALPESVTKRYDFKWPPSRSFMRPEEGGNCPTYEKRIVRPSGGVAAPEATVDGG